MRFGRAISIGIGAITGAILAGVFGGAIFEDYLPCGAGIGAERSWERCSAVLWALGAANYDAGVWAHQSQLFTIPALSWMPLFSGIPRANFLGNLSFRHFASR